MTDVKTDPASLRELADACERTNRWIAGDFGKSSRNLEDIAKALRALAAEKEAAPADLIAAAPDLLEACKDFLRADTPTLKNVAKNAMARAIAKAEGK